MEISNVKTNPFAPITKAEETEEEQLTEETVQNPLEKSESDKAEFFASKSILTNTQIQDTVTNYIKEKMVNADPKVAAKLSEFLTNFDVEKFVHNNGNISMAELYAILYNQTADYD